MATTTQKQDLEQKYQPEENSQFHEIIDLVKVLIQTILIVVVIRLSIIEPFRIPSTSMVPTLEIGDHILVNKLSFGLWIPIPFRTHSLFQWSKPQRGEIVVFTREDDPTTSNVDESSTNIIKRVIGLPGEKLLVHGTKIYINDKELEDPWGRWIHGGEKDFGPVVIPEGKVFLMGDNRDASLDSRFWYDPFLPITRIKGRAFIIYWNSELTFDSLKRIFKIIR